VKGASADDTDDAELTEPVDPTRFFTAPAAAAVFDVRRLAAAVAVDDATDALLLILLLLLFPCLGCDLLIGALPLPLPPAAAEAVPTELLSSADVSFFDPTPGFPR
jgi:hypothetical protein